LNTLLELETERLYLRKMQSEDAAFIVDIMNDPDWLTFIGDRNIATEGDALNHIQNVAQVMYEQHSLGMLVVIEKASSNTVGLAGMLQRDYLPHPDIGYAFLPCGRGKGYAFEAGQALIDRAQRVMPGTSFYATVDQKNSASIGLLSKLGFEFEKVISDTDKSEIHLFTLNPSGIN